MHGPPRGSRHHVHQLPLGSGATPAHRPLPHLPLLPLLTPARLPHPPLLPPARLPLLPLLPVVPHRQPVPALPLQRTRQLTHGRGVHAQAEHGGGAPRLPRGRHVRQVPRGQRPLHAGRRRPLGDDGEGGRGGGRGPAHWRRRGTKRCPLPTPLTACGLLNNQMDEVPAQLLGELPEPGEQRVPLQGVVHEPRPLLVLDPRGPSVVQDDGPVAEDQHVRQMHQVGIQGNLLHKGRQGPAGREGVAQVRGLRLGPGKAGFCPALPCPHT